MAYLVSFLEGVITFVSPCILPMIPIYLAYFAGGVGEGDGTSSQRSVLKNALGFVLGFTVVFVVLGAFAGTIGALLSAHQGVVNAVCGLAIMIFGLNFMGVFNIGILNRTIKVESSVLPEGFFSALLFGVVFAIGWTPCVGAFLGSALLLAAQQGSMMQGSLMLVCYSLGMGLPFVLSAVLVNQLEGAFSVIKKNYRVINLACGMLLVVMGLLMATGRMGALLTLLSV